MRIENLKRKEILIFATLLVIGCFIAYRVFHSANKSNQEVVIETLSSSSVENEEAENTIEESKMYVDIKGAVKLPGMYEVTSDMRILNVIDMAGGLSLEADDKQVNFSARVEDQMVIYIPKEGEDVSEVAVIQETQPSVGQSDGVNSEDKINLNVATKEELMRLNGVGEKKAEKIITYREENGSFESIEDLKKVNGFGEKSFESLKESITI